MRDNPLHQRVFASEDARLEPLLTEAFVRLLHRQMCTGCVLGAYESDEGIGSRLMVAICDQLDRNQGIGYLETDKPENVRLYRRGGFEVVAEQQIIGVTNWFMRRQPQSGVRLLAP